MDDAQHWKDSASREGLRFCGEDLKAALKEEEKVIEQLNGELAEAHLRRAGLAGCRRSCGDASHIKNFVI